ncbi:MAG: 2-oxo-hept-3-ene-1,7-dioate hydratase [Parasphingorhabdus sp.]|jgi:2-oxo-hept-3-ene-1,7-dioate hydratase
MLQKQDITTAAENLYRAEKARQQMPALTRQFPEMTMDDAYAIQSHWVGKKIADGESVIGYKIGLTSRAMQMAMNIDEPDYGVLLDSMNVPNGSTLKADDYLDPRVEVELAFILKHRLEGENISVVDVLNATDYVMPAMELIAARIQRTDPESGYQRRIYDTISDNAANAGVILGGRPIKPTEMDLRWAGAMLYQNSQIEETGLAGGVLGHPANGIGWVCRRFAPHGVALEPGQIILAGSFTRPVPVRKGDTFHADYGSLGTVSVSFE